MIKALQTTFTNMGIISAVTSTVFIILLGFFLRRRNILSDQTGKVLSKVVLTVALPPLAFNSFMAPINPATFHQGMSVLIWGILIYVILIFLTPLMYKRYPKDKATTMSVLTTFGSTTFFGIPIVGAVFGPTGVMYASIFNIGYRIFLYSYAYIKMSGLKMESKNIKTMFLNPIVIATFLGLILWLAQGIAPHIMAPITVGGSVANPKALASVAFYRIDQTALWLWTPLNYLGNLCSPMAWLAIGVTLGSISFKDAATDGTTWYYSFNKVILVPIINIILLTILAAVHILPMNGVALGTVVIMMAAPTATVAAAYAISFDHDAVLTSNSSLVSTVTAVVFTPIWIVVLQVISTMGLFK